MVLLTPDLGLLVSGSDRENQPLLGSHPLCRHPRRRSTVQWPCTRTKVQPVPGGEWIDNKEDPGRQTIWKPTGPMTRRCCWPGGGCNGWRWDNGVDVRYA